MAKRGKPRSERIGSRDDAIDIEEIKRTVKALQDREPPGVEASELAMRRDLLALRRSVAKRLAPLVVQGADDTAAKTILADYEKERNKLLKSKKSEVEKAMSALGDNQTQGIAGRLKALEILATPGLPFTPTSLTLSPFLIWAKNPSNMLLDSHSDPVGYSWAKISLSRTEIPPDETGTSLTFYYLWSNPSDYYAVVNANCSVVFNGTCVATAHTGIIDGGKSDVYCAATLSPSEWWNQPPTYPSTLYQPQAAWIVFTVAADGGSFLSLDDVEPAFLSGTARDLRFVLFAIPPGAAAVFAVNVLFNCSIDDGSIAIDFASKPNYSIACLMQLELLTAPSIAVTAGPSTA